MCGLYGYIGFKPTKIPLTTFLSLGVENDSRGGHGCGIFCDGQIEYGSSTDKYFEIFYDKSQLLKTIYKAEILIGHDRKASVGGISDDKLQPVCIYNSDDPEQIDFVLMHNGTILNHEELAQKYLSLPADESKKFTDSQIMARIIATHGFQVLGEYEGAGAFVMIDYRTPDRKPSVFVFKGETKEYSYSQTTSEERPLYYVRTTNGLWFSSMPNYLNIMCFNKPDVVYQFPTNKVVLINDGPVLKLVEDIDRSNRTQKKAYVTTYQSSQQTSQSHSYYPNNCGYYLADEYDAYYDDYDNCGVLNAQAPSNVTPLGVQDQSTDSEQKTNTILSSGIVPNVLTKGMLHCENFRFVDNATSIPLTGIYYVNDIGEYSLQQQQHYPYKLYLFNGIPVFGENVLNKIIDFCTLRTECINFDELLQYFPDVVYSFTFFPYYDPETHKYLRFYGKELGSECCDNVIIPFCTGPNRIYTFKDGHIDHYTTIQANNRKQFYQRYIKRCNKSHNNLIKYLMS